MFPIRKIGVLTSGGDSPGMNAAIRAVVRTAVNKGLEVVGIRYGYRGLIEKDFMPLTRSSVTGILQRGGTILKSSRCPEFRTDEGLATAYKNMQEEGIDALVVIGGDGTFRGALHFQATYKVPIIGLPGTIDNDIFGTTSTIGYDTALNTVVEAVDKLRDTANSHDILFFVEVMGRDAGFLAMNSGLASGADYIMIPEAKSSIDVLLQKLERERSLHKSSNIIMVAEGEALGGAQKVADEVKVRSGNKYQARVTVLGHIQRGGSPTCFDRVLASRLGYTAVVELLKGTKGVMVGLKHNKMTLTPFENATNRRNPLNTELLEVAEVLSA